MLSGSFRDSFHRQKKYERIKIVKINTLEKYMKKDVKKYVYESMSDLMNVNNEFTIKNSKVKNRKFNIATSNQSQS